MRAAAAPVRDNITEQMLAQFGADLAALHSRCWREGCDRKHYARGWCRMHYDRIRHRGDPGPCESVRPVLPPLTGPEEIVAESRAALERLRAFLEEVEG